MDDNYQDEHITRELQDTAQSTDPPSEHYNQLLQEILQKAGAEESVNYEEAAAQVEHMSNFRVAQSAGHALKSRTGIVAIAAAFFLVIAVTQFLPRQSENYVIVDPNVPLAAPLVHDGVSYRADGVDVVSGDQPENPPQLVKLQISGQELELQFEHGEEIQWERLYAEDSVGKRVELDLDPDGQSLRLALPQNDLTVFFEDASGTSFEVVVWVE